MKRISIFGFVSLLGVGLLVTGQKHSHVQRHHRHPEQHQARGYGYQQQYSQGFSHNQGQN